MKRFLLFALAVIMFAACSKDAIDEQQNMQTIVDEAPETLVVGFEESDETRIQLNEEVKTVWTNGDQVSVFYRSDANQKWHYQGETGERVAELTRVEAGVATEAMKRVVVVYPYNDDYYINTETYNIQAFLPAVQTYLKDSYGLDGNIMISSSEYNNFSLKSVCGWLKLQLTGNGEKVKSITLRGNNGEQVAGELYINSADATATLSSDTGSDDDGETGGAGGGLVFEDTILKEVTLDCSEGVELGAEAAAFYIALPPQTFENGFTVEIEAMDGHIMTKSTDKTLTIERNHIQPMTTFDFAPSYPLSNEIFYTASEQVTPTNPEAFGTTFISSSWDAETGTGVMLFEDELSYIGDYAFEGNAALLSVLLPNSVTELRNCCFRYCSNLTKAVIPGEITDFQSASFEQCHALATINCRYSTSDLRHVVMNNIYLAYAPAGAEDCVIPNGVKYVESYVFRGSNIASVVIPASVNNIGEQAFLKSANLMAVYCKPTTPPAINAGVNGGIFDGNASGRKIYVPKESVWAYKTAEHWSDYADAIVGYDFETGKAMPELGIYDTAVDPDKYLVYVANRSVKFGLTSSRDYNVWDTYFENPATGICVAEYKFQLPEVTDEWTPISDDYIEIMGSQINVYNGYRYNNYDGRVSVYTKFDLSTIGVEPTDVITLRIDDINDIVTINGIAMEGAIQHAMDKYIYSSYYSEWDEGAYRQYSGITEGTKLYYAKGWDSYGRLQYVGYAGITTNPDTGNEEACWKAQYYTNSSVFETDTFANNRYLSGEYVPLGMGNLQ